MEQALGKKREKKNTAVLLVIVAVVLLLCAGSFLYQQSKVFVYEEYLDREILSVDGAGVTLREFGYYILSLEEFVNQQALLYDSSNPLAYWNKHFRAGIQGTFVSSMAQKKAYETCICDQIYYQMAVDAGYELDEKDKEKVDGLAEEFWKKQKPEQIEKTGISRDMVQTICEKKVLIAKFAKDYVRQIDFTGYQGYREELVSAGGDYYKKEILPDHKVKIDQNVRGGLRFGRITINDR